MRYGADKFVQNFSSLNLERREPFWETGKHEEVILNWILNIKCVTMFSGLNWLRIRARSRLL
jgi:hypothetical protein